MFDPTDYFQRVERAVKSCSKWVEVTGLEPQFPQIEVDRFRQWKLVVWRCEALFPVKQKVIAFEGHERGSHGEHLRNIRYQFMDENGTLIFRVDTHGLKIPFSDCPHLHPGPTGEPIIEEGDPRLGNNSLKQFDFLEFWAWVHEYLSDNRRLPWRQ